MDYDLKNRHNWKYHTQENRPLTVAVSAYMHQLNETSYPAPLVKNTTLINSKNYSKLTCSTRLITNKSYVKCFS